MCAATSQERAVRRLLLSPDLGCCSPPRGQQQRTGVKRKGASMESWFSWKGLEAYAGEGMCALFIRCRSGGPTYTHLWMGGVLVVQVFS